MSVAVSFPLAKSRVEQLQTNFLEEACDGFCYDVEDHVEDHHSKCFSN